MEVLFTALAIFVCVPGSLLLVAVGAWKLLSRFLGFKKPEFDTLRDVQGNVVYSEADWHRHNKARSPVRYAIFERLPVYLRGVGQRVKRAFTFRTTRSRILHRAFDSFVDWVDAHYDLVTTDLPVLDQEDGLAARRNDRMAEIRELYDWWLIGRPAHVVKIDELPDVVREFSVIDLELDDQHNLARLVNVWRDLV